MLGEVKNDHMPVNKYTLFVLGMPPIYFSKVAGIEEELQTVDLPDRSKVSGGNTAPFEFTTESMLHHHIEQAAIELWYKEAQDPVSPLYKKPATLIHHSLSGSTLRSFTLIGVFPRKRKLPDLDKANEGDPAVVEWTFAADNILPI